MKKTVCYRTLFYAAGLLILALGLTLNTKAGLGVSAIISVSYSVSLIFELNFGNVTLGLYTVYVLIELVLHLLHNHRAKQRLPEALLPSRKTNIKYILLVDILQIPLSIAFTRFLNVFSALLPDFPEEPGSAPSLFFLRLLTVIAAIILTGVGAAMSLNMRLVPNPGDGIVQAIADTIHKSVGFSKNCFDLVNITLAAALGLLFTGKLQGVGIGTVLAVIGVGRVIAVFNRFACEKMKTAAGVRD